MPATALLRGRRFAAGADPHSLRLPELRRDVLPRPRLKFLQAAQAVGLSLADIREILRIRDSGSAPCRHVVSLLEQRRAQVAARIRELRQLEHDLAELGTAGKDLDPAQCDPRGICDVISLEHHTAQSAGHPPDRPHRFTTEELTHDR